MRGIKRLLVGVSASVLAIALVTMPFSLAFAGEDDAASLHPLAESAEQAEKDVEELPGDTSSGSPESPIDDSEGLASSSADEVDTNTGSGSADVSAPEETPSSPEAPSGPSEDQNQDSATAAPDASPSEVTGESKDEQREVEGAANPEILSEQEPSATGSDGGSATKASKPAVQVEAHVQNRGWLRPVGEQAVVGTVGQNLNLEGLRLHLSGADGSDIQVMAHVRNIGWQDWVSSNGVAGTVGKNLPIEAIKIRLTGELSNSYDVWYQVHSADFGWSGWAKNGESAGSQGYAKSAQAVRVVLLPKNSSAPGSTANAFRTYAIGYSAHVQNIGWQGKVADGAQAGTTGKNLNLEALTISLGGSAGSGAVQVRAHVQNIGWQGWTSGQAGTTGRNLPIEALQIKLTGDAANSYDVWYRVHSADFGWGGWASNGASAGSQGYAKAAQAVEIQLVAKGKGAPGSTANAFRCPTAIWSAHISEIGWRSSKSSSSTPSFTLGTTGQAKSLEAFTLSLPGLGPGSVSYSAHVSNIGWQKAVSDGATAGTTGRGLPIEAVKISLNGSLGDTYDIWYRAHVRNIGWLGWTKNGEPAGSEGLASPVEAIEVRVLKKGSAAPGAGTAFLAKPTISYSAYSVGKGWGAATSNGGTAGATGQNRAVEAFKVSYSGAVSGGVSYKAHLANVGWQGAVTNNAIAGAAGKGNDLQAISISLTGDAAKYFDVWYRVHVENYGWLGWAKNGAYAGTTKLNLQVEAIQVTVTGKGSAAPGSTTRSYFDHYVYIGWQNPSQYPQVSCNTVKLPDYCKGEFTYVTPSRIPYNATREDCVNAFIQRAYEYLGTRYIEPYSTAPGGAVDCSGLVLQCLYATGMDLGWYNPYNHRWLPEQTYNSTNWYRNNTFMPVSVSSIKRGDLIYYRGHVAIYIGNGQIIDSWPGRGVTIRGINAPGTVIGAARPFVG